MDIREQLSNALEKVIADFKKEGLIPESRTYRFNVDIPRNRQFGDFSTNLSFLLAKDMKKAPKDIAALMMEKFDRETAPAIGKIEIAPNGYLNFFASQDFVHHIIKKIESENEKFGHSNTGHGLKIQIEFVSANPTGPLNVVSARAASVGDAMGNFMNAAGYNAFKEFYVNDAGVQARLLGESFKIRYLQQFGIDHPIPENGYHGEYLVELAQLAKEQNFFPGFSDPESIPVEEFSRVGLEWMLQKQKEDLSAFGVNFDCWFRETKLHAENKPLKVLELLKQKGYVYESEGATWFRSTDFGDEKDRVLVKSDGLTTYFLNDIAYHHDKFERGFEKVIDIWGPDHHGHIIRMKAAMKALGHPEDALEILIVQQVNLLRKGEKVKMSKRAGQIETMEDLVKEVGVDAARFFFLLRGSDSHLDFDLEVAKYQTNDNPVFYVQYAHARVCSVFAKAIEKGFTIPSTAEVDLSKLAAPEEAEIVKILANYPDVVADAAKAYEPHRVVRYMMDLATKLHQYYNQYQIIGEDVELTRARLVLLKIIQIVLKNGLKSLGVSQPERM
jgi:arginyl-tRNA synthetase